MHKEIISKRIKGLNQYLRTTSFHLSLFFGQLRVISCIFMHSVDKKDKQL